VIIVWPPNHTFSHVRFRVLEIGHTIAALHAVSGLPSSNPWALRSLVALFGNYNILWSTYPRSHSASLRTHHHPFFWTHLYSSSSECITDHLRHCPCSHHVQDFLRKPSSGSLGEMVYHGSCLRPGAFPLGRRRVDSRAAAKKCPRYYPSGMALASRHLALPWPECGYSNHCVVVLLSLEYALMRVKAVNNLWCSLNKTETYTEPDRCWTHWFCGLLVRCVQTRL
jgi:hypothetical protein